DRRTGLGEPGAESRFEVAHGVEVDLPGQLEHLRSHYRQVSPTMSTEHRMWDANRRLPQGDASSGGRRRSWRGEADPAPGPPSSPTAFPAGPGSKTLTARSTGRCCGHVYRPIRT